MELGGSYIVKSGAKDTWRLWAVGDVHLGSRACSLNRFKETIKAIDADPKALWIGMGDYAEYIGFKDKRFDPAGISDDIKVSDLGKIGSVHQHMFMDLVYPIRKKCVGLLKGNHEERYEHHTHSEHMHAEMCEKLGVKDLGYSCFVDLIFRTRSQDYKFRVVAHHGAGYASTTGGKVNKLIRFMNDFPLADVFIMGHVHQKLQHSRPIISANEDCTKLVEINQLGVVSGSYLKTYSEGAATYGEMKGYSPVALGSSAIIIHPSSRALGVDWA